MTETERLIELCGCEVECEVLAACYGGPCPDGMECRHRDGNVKNNDFKNLIWGTHKQNAQDMVKHGTAHLLTKNRRPEITYGCGGKFGEDHPMSKLSNHGRREMYSKYHSGNCTQRELADEFGMSPAATAKIVNDERWK